MTTAPIEHPRKPGVWGVFVPYAGPLRWSPSVWVPWQWVPGAPPTGYFGPEALIEFLRAHEFDVDRPFESVPMDDRQGWGYFYLQGDP